MSRYLVGLLVAIGLIIITLVLFFGGNSHPKSKAAQNSLINYANTSATVSMTITGPITAPQNHNVLDIIVGNNSATYNAYVGYDNNLVSSQTFPNTLNSYSDFLAALNLAGYMQGDTSPAHSDNRGYCATGNNYIFKITENGNTIQRFWATNCSGVPKTYLGSLAPTINLFEAQIPNFNDVSNQVGLN